MAVQAFAAIQDQVQGSVGSWIDLRPGGAKVEFGQTFQPGIAGRLESIEHNGLSPTSVAEYPTMFDIVDVSGGQPGTNLLGRTVITNISAQTRVYFTNQSIYLETNASYAIVASTEAPLTTSRAYYFRASLGDVYLPGMLWARAPGGAWAPGDMWGTPRDLVFATYMEPGIPPVRITKPAAGALVTAGRTVQVAAAVSAQVTNAALVKFYAAGVDLGNDSNAPYALDWTPAIPGAVDLVAVLQTTAGVSITSSVCQVTATPVRPANDDFANRLTVTGEVVVASIDQSNATIEAGEPRPFASSAGQTVWWEWASPRNAWATVTVTPAPETNALLSVYTGSQVAALYQRAAGAGTVVCLMETTTPSEIAVDSAAGTLAGRSLMMVLNDIEISSPAANTVLYAPASFTVSAQRTANIRDLTNVSVLANGVLLGQMPADSDQLSCDISSSGFYDLQLAATDSLGITTFSQKVPIAVRPGNDNVAAAQVVSGREVVIHTTNLGATKEGLDPKWADNQGGHSIWYQWTAPGDGLCVIDGRGTNFALLINVCAVTTTTVVTNGVTNVVSSMAVVAANAMANTYSPVQFGATAGTTYLISLDGFWGEQGELDWNLHLNPYNDNFSNRRVLAGFASQLTDTNSGATLQSQETAIAPSGSGSSIWYSWQAPIPGPVTIQLTATNPIAVVVFTGTILTNLTLVAQSGDWTNSPIVMFEVQEGETYQIGVFGPASLEGAFNFNLFWKGLRFVSPSPNTIWPAPATLAVEVQREMAGETLKEVSVSANGSVIANFTNPPFSFNWAVPAAGSYTLSAHGVTVDDKAYDSPPLSCLIYDDDQLPRPRVYAGAQSDTSYVLNGIGALHLFGVDAEQFGRSSTNVLSSPFLGAWPAGVTGWKEISGSWAISDSGALYQKGQTQIPFPTGVTRWKHVSCGFGGVVTVGDDGDLYLGGTSRIPVTQPPGGWRDARASLTNLNNIILGLGEDQEAYLVSYTNSQWVSILLPRPSGVAPWKAISQAALFGVLLTEDGWLWIYGMQGGVTGPSGTPGFTVVSKPLGVRRWVDFSAGGYHVMALSDSGNLYTWGRNVEHQLGLGPDQNTRATPTKVQRPPGVAGWSAIAAGQFHSLAIGQDCNLYAWGENSSGQLGQPISGQLVTPTPVASLLSLCGTPIIFTDGNASQLPDGSFRLRFNTDLNRAYLIQYGDGTGVWKNANDSIVGTGGLVEWIDDGPPKTEVHPSAATSRMYRVIYAP